MRFTICYYAQDHLKMRESQEDTPMMKHCQTVADSIKADRFEIHDKQNGDTFKQVTRKGEAWSSNMVAAQEPARI